MATLRQLIGDVLLECGQPDTGAPPLDFVAMKVRDAAAELKVRAQNVGFNWETTESTFTTANGEDVYPLLPPSARPVFITTADPLDTRHVPRTVPLVDPQQVTQFYKGPNRTEGQRHETVCFSLWRETDGRHRLRPHPAQTATLSFTLWYESGVIPQALGDTALAGLGGFDAYLKIKAALGVLPQCEWSRALGPNADKLDPLVRMNVFAQMRRPIAESLVGQLALWEAAFKRYLNNGWEQGAPVTVAYGDWLGGPESWV